MQMQINDLRNLIVMARKGMAAFGSDIDAAQAKAGWDAIGNGEGFLKHFEQVVAQQQAANAPSVVTEGNEAGTTSDLHIVNLNEDGTVNEDNKPKVEDDES